MKKIDQGKYLCIAISTISLVLFVCGFQLVAGILAALSNLMIGINKHKSGGFFTIASFICYVIAGITVDYPFINFPSTLVFLVLIGITLNIRNWFFEKMFLYRFPKFELIAINLWVLCFIIFAILNKYSLQQWLIGGSSVILFVFFSLVIYKDRNDARLQVSNLKYKTGVAAKDFSLYDQNGNLVTLKKLLETQHILLIFVRGDWCPTCHMMLRGYFKNKEKFAEKNIKIVGIGPDPQGVNKEIMSRIDENALMLSDDGQETSVVYSNELQGNNPITKSLYKNGIPLPASFLVHQNGNIIYTSRSDKAAEILQPDKIFEVLKTLQ